MWAHTECATSGKFAMGADGGTIPKRCELVRKKKKKEKIEKSYEAATKWRTCQLSQQPLKKPIVCCKLGRLYNKEAVLEAKLNKTLSKNKATEHIHAFADVKELKLADNRAWKDNGPEKGDIYIDMNESPWVCPITALPMNGVNVFFVNWKCGCVFSEKAHNELKTNSCYGCGGPMDEGQFIKLYPEEELFRIYQQRLDELAQRRQKKAEEKVGEKKRKLTSDEKSADHPKKTKAEDETRFGSIQDNPNVPKAVKSMFTTSEEAKKQPTAHWQRKEENLAGISIFMSRGRGHLLFEGMTECESLVSVKGSSSSGNEGGEIR
uniref:Replication termination factor 2 n=1 Tax=Globodera rostochiensis TaxID=31243 RepID=A0A914GTF0_GLORO